MDRRDEFITFRASASGVGNDKKVTNEISSCTDNRNSLWSGACSAADRAKLGYFVSRCKRLEYCSSEVPTYSDLTDEADDTLFSRIIANHGHVLQPLLPDRHSIPYSLRTIA